MKQPTLNFLGSDAGFGAQNNSAYIETEGNFLLIDCGLTVFPQLKEKFDFSKYQEIFVLITHLHNDHAGSLSQFILYIWFVYQKKVTVVSQCRNIKEYLEITGTTKEAYEIKDSLACLEWIPTQHVKELDTYGWKMELAGRKIVYTADTKTLEPFLPVLEQANEFYVDVSKNADVHLKLEEVLETLVNLKKQGIDVYLMHTDDKAYINQRIVGTGLELIGEDK